MKEERYYSLRIYATIIEFDMGHKEIANIYRKFIYEFIFAVVHNCIKMQIQKANKKCFPRCK